MYPGKQAVLWLKRRAWPIAKIAVVICVAFWAGAQYEKGWRVAVIAPPQPGLPDAQMLPPKPSPAAKPLDFSDLIPACATPPQNGWAIDINRISNKPLHEIIVHNGNDSAAIVKARDADSGRLVMSIFVAADSTATYNRLPDGTYRFEFVLGDGLGKDCRSFIRPHDAQRFPGDKPMYARLTDTEEIDQTEELTINPVVGGNVRTESISMEAFDAP